MTLSYGAAPPAELAAVRAATAATADRVTARQAAMPSVDVTEDDGGAAEAHEDEPRSDRTGRVNVLELD